MQCFIIEEEKLLLVFIEMIEDRISIFSDCNNGEIKQKWNHLQGSILLTQIITM